MRVWGGFSFSCKAKGYTLGCSRLAKAVCPDGTAVWPFLSQHAARWFQHYVTVAQTIIVVVPSTATTKLLLCRQYGTTPVCALGYYCTVYCTGPDHNTKFAVFGIFFSIMSELFRTGPLKPAGVQV